MDISVERAQPKGWEPPDWVALGGLLLTAVIVRAIFFTGFFGSDEITYTKAAYGILTGEWPSSEYIGALRYGVSLPVAMFMKLFGVNEVAANLWSFITSVGEVALVFVLGRKLWGLRAAFLAAMTLALLPLHVHVAGRLVADAPLAFFMTLSCLLFLLGEARPRALWYLAAGVAAGASFWVKESPIIYAAIFGLYALVRRRWDARWLWMALGALAMLALNLMLMSAVTGDAWHVFRVTHLAVDQYREVYETETSPWFYLRYLLLDIRHTWLLAFLAIGGLIVLARERIRGGALASEEVFVLVWTAGMLGVFSLLPISFDPPKLISKQTNYMLMFVAPLALLSGLALSRLRGGALMLVTAALVLGSVTLAGLEQQAIQVFTANSKAAVQFAETVPGATIYATSNNVNAKIYSNLMRGKGAQEDQFRDFSELPSGGGDGESASKQTFAVVDLETIGWGYNRGGIRRIEDVPACWERKGQLQPVGPGGQGRFAVQAMLVVAEALPASLRARALAKLATLASPEPAYVYRIGAGCSQ